MSNKEYKNFEIKSVNFNENNKELIIEGYAATFDNKDAVQWEWHPDLREYVKTSDTIRKGAFSKTLNERKSRIAICLNHNIEDAKGKLNEAYEDEKGLFISIRISDAEPELKTKLREGIYNEFSIGFNTIKSLMSKDDENSDIYTREILEIKLYEISIVTIARDENAKITDVKSILNNIDDIIKFEQDETKKQKLIELKTLYCNKPITSLADTKPSIINQFEFNFITK